MTHTAASQGQSWGSLSQAKCHHHQLLTSKLLPGESKGDKGGSWFSMLTTLHAIGTRQTSTRDKQCNWRKKIHTNPFSLSLVWKTLPITANKVELEGWPSPGRLNPLLLLSIPPSSTCLGVVLPPALPQHMAASPADS